MDRHEGKRISRIFEIHDDLSEHSEIYTKWLVDKKIPMIVGDKFPISSPHVSVFPFKSANALMGEKLSSTPAYMMAYALLQPNVTEIGIYGVDMAVDDHEYFLQRPVMYAWIGYAIAKGIKITIPQESSLFKDTYVEGRDWGGKPALGVKPFTEAEFTTMFDLHGQKKEEIKQQMAQLQSDYNTHDGCQQAYRKLAQTARAVESGQQIDTLTQTTRIL